MAKLLTPAEGIRAEGSPNFQAVLEPHEERIITEAKELRLKIDKLTAFLDEQDKKRTVSYKQKALLQNQLAHMSAYLTILEQRVGMIVLE